MPRWALPDYVEDILPPEGARLERVRRALIDLCFAAGYGLVQPPLIEFADTLTAGTNELDDHLFKVVDQLSGRLLGVRADMTPQAARIDAHLYGHVAENRLCYAGSVLHTRPSALNATREVVQGGAELYGLPGRAGDEEVLRLLLRICATLGIGGLHVDIGHAAVFNALSDSAALSPIARERAREALQRKDAGALQIVTTDPAITALLLLYGDAPTTLAQARKTLPGTAIANALDDLADLASIADTCGANVTIDLADVPSYAYHTGVVYSVFAAGESTALARGGRYDNIGSVYGAPAPRPATGFSLDLRLAAACTQIV